MTNSIKTQENVRLSSTGKYMVGSTIQVNIIKKNFAPVGEEPSWQLIGKNREKITCFVDRESILDPVWGAIFEAKVVRVNKNCLVVDLQRQVGIWAQPKRGQTVLFDENSGQHFVKHVSESANGAASCGATSNESQPEASYAKTVDIILRRWSAIS